MSATTVNAFPPLHAFNSSRSWALAAIVLVHLGFFWALTHGVTIWDVQRTPPPFVVVDVPTQPQAPPQPIKPVEPVAQHIWLATPLARGCVPLIIEPALAARYPFTEPEYPVSEIRLGHEGTVLLALQILPNGRVGEVRIDNSSGFVQLGEACVREEGPR